MRTRSLIISVLTIIIAGATTSCGDDDARAAAREKAEALAAKRPTPDERAAATAVAIEPDPALRSAVAMIARGAFAEARDVVVPFLDDHPDDGAGVFLLGLTYHREDRYAEARPHFQRAVQLEPGYSIAHQHLGECRSHLGDDRGARDALLRAVELDDGDPRVYEMLSQVYGRLGDEASAARALETYRARTGDGG